MSSRDKASGMKSAYELALERLEADGIAPPDDDAFSEEARREIADIRSRAEAKVAELEILHRDRIRSLAGAERDEAEEDFRREKRRIEDERERKIAALRSSGTGRPPRSTE